MQLPLHPVFESVIPIESSFFISSFIRDISSSNKIDSSLDSSFFPSIISKVVLSIFISDKSIISSSICLFIIVSSCAIDPFLDLFFTRVLRFSLRSLKSSIKIPSLNKSTSFHFLSYYILSRH